MILEDNVPEYTKRVIIVGYGKGNVLSTSVMVHTREDYLDENGVVMFSKTLSEPVTEEKANTEATKRGQPYWDDQDLAKVAGAEMPPAEVFVKADEP